MASSSWCLYAAAATSLARCSPSPSPTRPPTVCRCSCILLPRPTLPRRSRVRRNAVVCMAPEEEKMTRRSPLDFPINSEDAEFLHKYFEACRYGNFIDLGSEPASYGCSQPFLINLDPPEEDDEEEEEKKEEEEEDPGCNVEDSLEQW